VIEEFSYRSSSRVEMRLEREPCDFMKVAKVMYLQNNVRHAQNKTIYEDLSLKTKGNKKETLLSKKCSSMEYIYVVNKL
jgi:hypothetical protein